MKKIEITVTEETYKQLTALKEVVNYLNKDFKNELQIEDIAKGAIIDYLDKYFHITSDQKINLIKCQELGKPYPLKNNFEKYFKNRKETMEDIANELNLTKGTISNILSNKHQPTLDVFLRLWVKIGCPPLHEVLYRESP